MSDIKNPDQEIGYLKGKCEIYERMFPQLVESLMNIANIAIQKERENPMDGLFKAFFSSPVFMEQLRPPIKNAFDKVEKEREVGKPSI